MVSSLMQGSTRLVLIQALKQVQHEPHPDPDAVCRRLGLWAERNPQIQQYQHFRESRPVSRRSLAEALTAALGGDAALSAMTPLRTWEETVVPQVC